TRSAVVELDDDAVEADTLAEMVEEAVRQRRFERVVRLEYAAGGSAAQLGLLTRQLDLTETDLHDMPAELYVPDHFPIAGLNRPELRDPPWQPIVPAPLGDEDADVFAAMRSGGDFLVHHPYESFAASVERFLRSAAEDPRVLAIKMTAYRVGADTP